MLFITNTSLVTYPVLVIEVEGVKCRALIDTGAGSSCASSKLINKIKKKPIRRETKRIETLMHSVVKKSEIYHFEIGDINQEFKIGIEINKLEKEVLLELPNPNYPEIQKSYVVLGGEDYTKIKTQEATRRTHCRIDKTWVGCNFAGQETSVTKMLFYKPQSMTMRIHVIWMYLVSRMNTQKGMEKYTMNSKNNLGAVMKGGMKQI